ncbi:MAG: leucyl aminopeptidase [Nanoarchaeota archaeon]
MQLEVTSQLPETVKADALFLPVYEGTLGHVAARMDRELKGQLQSFISLEEFHGKYGKFMTTSYNGTLRRVILVGLGKKDELTEDKLKKIFGSISRLAREIKTKKIAVALDDLQGDETNLGNIAAQGLLLGNYRYDLYKTQDKDNIPVDTAILLTEKKVQAGVKEGIIIADSMIIVRNLVNTPSMIKVPVYLAQEAKKICKEAHVSIDIYGREKIGRMGMHGLLAVNAGSVNEPQFLVMEYRPRYPRKKIVFVGKGITFDSGGLGIKPGKNMLTMKEDMTGAATVIALLRAASLLKLPYHLIGIAPLTENMPGNNAYKPGDILKTYNGKTMEILHTDAEGSVILADALGYASALKPDVIIDLATLTGAMVIALGTCAAGVMGNNDVLAQQLVAAGKATGEKVWQMPLYEEYDEMIKSDVADVKNLGSWDGIAGGLTAAAFLKAFVDEKIPWAHLDIAGVSFIDKDEGYYCKGGTGFGINLLLEYLRNLE